MLKAYPVYRILITAILSMFLMGAATATCPPPPRSQTVLRHFRKAHPCPATGRTTGPCVSPDGTKYVIDHIVPLCLGPAAGGIDAVSNLAWQEYQDSLLKDRFERQMCRAHPRPCLPRAKASRQ